MEPTVLQQSQMQGKQSRMQLHHGVALCVQNICAFDFCEHKNAMHCSLRHGVEGVFKVNVDSITSPALFPSFLLYAVHFLPVNAYATSLPASTLPWF